MVGEKNEVENSEKSKLKKTNLCSESLSKGLQLSPSLLNKLTETENGSSKIVLPNYTKNPIPKLKSKERIKDKDFNKSTLNRNRGCTENLSYRLTISFSKYIDLECTFTLCNSGYKASDFSSSNKKL